MDFCNLNRMSKDHYLLPLIPDLLNSPGPARIYTKVNLKNANHLVHILEGEKPKMAFCMLYRSYEWWVMQFSLSNAPVAFQCFINDVLGDLLDMCMVGYLDDILIYLESLESHREHVKEVLWQLKRVGLYTNSNKCKFPTDTVEYLGFILILSLAGLSMDPSKVLAIQEWPEL